MSRRNLAALLIGLGLGAVGAVLAGPVAFWPGAALVVMGAVVAGTATRTRDLVGEAAPTAERMPAPTEPTSAGPAGLGGRVEQVLRLAEEQAQDLRSEARREAERIIADARAEAARVRGSAP